ncbi:MAG: iron ABC transporter permease [Actinobacteria bacterium]|nr:iron ABC transporter permease [Actinomycetota bacterium]
MDAKTVRLVTVGHRNRTWTVAGLAIPAVFLGWFFIYPVTTIIVKGLSGGDGSPLETIVSVLGRGSVRRIVWFTLWQATVSTLLTLIVALPATWVMAHRTFRGKETLRALLLVPFVLPTVVVGAAFTFALGPEGPLGVDLRRTVWAILIAHVFYNVPIVIRTVGSFWERIPEELTHAARTLGESPLRTFLRVTLPLLRPALAAASAIVFLLTFTSFGVILILGDLGHSTLEVEIWRQATGLLRFEVAAVLALAQLTVVGVALAFYTRYERTKSVRFTGSRISSAHPFARGRDRRIGVGILVVTVGGLIGPILVLFRTAFRVDGAWTTDAFTSLSTRASTAGLFVPPSEALANTARFSTAAVVIAVGIGAMIAVVLTRARPRVATLFDTVVMLPLGTSAVTIGFGMLVALDRPIDLRTSWILLPIAHALVAIPFVVRSMTPALRSISTDIRAAAATLGASPREIWRRIEFPIVKGAVIIGAAFATAISVGEFGATSFLVRPDRPTLPIAIFRLLGQPGSINQAQAAALATILVGIVAVVAFILQRSGDRGEQL